MAAFSRSFVSRWSLPLLLGLAGACTGSSAPPKGQLMVALNTDMSIPKDVSRIRVRVKLGAEVRYEYDYIIAPDGKFHIPGTLAVVEGSTPNPVVTVEVIGLRTQGGKLQARTFGKAITSIPTERTALLEMPVQWLCDGQVADLGEESFITTCDPNLETGEETACVAGDCKPVAVSPDALATYNPQAVYGGGDTANAPNAFCFDTLTCFDRGTSLSAADFDAGCTYTLPDDGSTPNFAVVTKDGSAGICHDGDATPCYVPLDQDDRTGWHFDANAPAGKRVAVLPSGVCKSLSDQRAEAVRFTTACATKTTSSPTCGDWSAISTPAPPSNEGGGSGGTTNGSAGTATGNGGKGNASSGGKATAGGQPGFAGQSSNVGGTLGSAGAAVDVGGSSGQAMGGSANGGDAGAAGADGGTAQGGSSGSTSGGMAGFQTGTAGAAPVIDCSGDITFASAGLESIIRERLEKPSGPITGADLAGMTTLTANSAGITSLGGIECAVNLGVADFSSNTITDLGPLATLKSLTSLNLDFNGVSSALPLAGLANLTYLNLGHNPLATLSGLENAAGEVDLLGCAISDVSAWTDNTGITRLTLKNNQITDPAPLGTLSSLVKLDLAGNPLASIDGLGSLPPSFTELDLSATGITSLTALNLLTTLQFLFLSTNGITDSDLLPVANLPALVQIDVADNALTTLTPLSGLANLGYVSAGNNQISDISALGGLSNLRDVDLHLNLVTDLSALVANTSFGESDTLNVNDNPLCDTYNVYLLEQRGVVVQQNIGGCG
jgi:Leucine-rich repeat (LRR) protein